MLAFLLGHPLVAFVWFVIGVVAGAVAMYLVLHKNRRFLNWSLKSLEQAALNKASGK